MVNTWTRQLALSRPSRPGYHGGMSSSDVLPPVPSLVVQSLIQVVRDQATRMSLDNGSMHEDELVVAMARFLQHHDIPADLVELEASNFLFSVSPSQLSPTQAKTYDRFTALFMDMGGPLLHVGYGAPSDRRYTSNSLSVFSYPDRQALLASLAWVPAQHHWSAWSMDSEEESSFSGSGRDALRGVLDLPALAAEFGRLALDKDTAPAPGLSSRIPRL